MPEPTKVLRPSPEFESAEASVAFQMLEDVSRRLWKDVQELGPDELAWQPAPGINTIGMLLIHIAISEVYWVSMLTETAFLCPQVLGVKPEDDGLPLAADAPAPAALAGRPPSYFQDLLMKAREHTRKSVARLTAADLDKEIEVRGRTRSHTVNGRWTLLHLVEHEIGHHAQISLLRHLHRATHSTPRA